MRLRGSVRHRFEGRPRITIEWPTLWQRYDDPFEFSFFSPRSYIETGPALNLYIRPARAWEVSLYGRSGVQREDGRSADLFGTVRGAIAREASAGWTVRAAAGWSNSNLASSSSFRRTSFSLDLIRRID